MFTMRMIFCFTLSKAMTLSKSIRSTSWKDSVSSVSTRVAGSL